MPQVWLKSRQQIEFFIDYQLYYGPSYGQNFTTAHNFRISHSPSEGSLTVILVNRIMRGDIFESNRVYAPGEPLVDVLIEGEQWTALPQIVFAVDGIWQEDPIQNGLHNFNFSWATN